MARLPFITVGIFFVIGAAGATNFAHAQVPRPGMPGQTPTQPPASQARGAQIPGATVTAPAGSQPAQPASRTESSTGATVPPVVTYKDGLLTVQALNSNLGSVVKAIRSKTGIEFEGAENISEPVAISLGPAPAGDVLSAIFSGSKYDFVALGRPDSPSIVQRVILTVKNNAGAPGQAQPQARQVPQGEGDDEEVPDEQPNGGDPQDTPVQPPQIPQQQPPQPENQPQQQPKTPEQLLQELQQMNQNQQNQKAPPDPQNPSTAPRKMPPRAN